MFKDIGQFATMYPKIMGKLTVELMKNDEENLWPKIGREFEEVDVELPAERLEEILNKAVLVAHDAPAEKLEELRNQFNEKIEQLHKVNELVDKNNYLGNKRR